jgi:hypothetical protein
MRVIGCPDQPDEDVEFCQHRNMGWCEKHSGWCGAYPEPDSTQGENESAEIKD